jgi:pyruvate ferredoxin oxidoreductase beta subunit
MACAPAGAQGVRDALDILKARGKLAAEQDRKVVVLTGDGAAQDIGLQSTMAAIDRGLDFYYLCYDNESYGNTGFQTSASTPYGSRTATTPITASSPHGSLHERRDLFEIWRVQKPPYLATISATYPLDLSEKVYRAAKHKGPKLFIALSPCPPGWEIDPEWSVDIARLAVETGIWPLKEAVHGEVTHTYVPRKFEPVENYLKRQGRFRHLFEPRRDEETIAHIQRTVDDYWKAASSDPPPLSSPASGGG